MTTPSIEAEIAFPAPKAQWAKQPHFRQTQLGNAERLVHTYSSNIKFCHAWKWLVWDGRRWRCDDTGAIHRMAMSTIRSIGQEAKAESDDDLRGWAKRSESNYHLKAMAEMAQNMTNVRVDTSAFDQDQYKFNCANGTIDLRTGTLRPHSREDLITKLSSVEYRPDAECPQWLGFLERILNSDAALINFMQKAIGYSLTGAVTEKALFFLHGSGDNGKTTLLEAVRRIMGEYAGTAEVEAFMKDASTAEKERATADLAGKRFVTASEAAQGHSLNEAHVKKLTGMGRLSGRRIYCSAFEFDPNFKLFIDANHKPSLSVADQAIWNRLRLIPFEVSIPKDQQDKNLLVKFAAEAPGILAWAVQGCLRWQSEGLGPPVAVLQATEAYREEVDSVSDFIADRCIQDPGATEKFSDLYADYCDWSKKYSEKPISAKAFGQTLDRKGFTLDRKPGVRCRKGLKRGQEPLAEQPLDTAYNA